MKVLQINTRKIKYAAIYCDNAFLTVLRLLPHDALQVHAGSRLTGSQALWLGRQRRVDGVHGDRARADHDLLAGRRDVAAAGAEEVERGRSWGGDRRLHLDGGQRRRERNQTRECKHRRAGRKSNVMFSWRRNKENHLSR